MPESIYNLSDFVIQNSINNHNSQQYRLIDSVGGASDFNNLQAVSPREESQSRDTTPYRQINEAESLKFSFEGEKLRVALRDMKSSDLSGV